jgi:hypothetical protein
VQDSRGPSRASQAAGAALACVLAAAGFVAWSWPLVRTIRTDTIVLGTDTVQRDGSAPQADWSLIMANDQTLSLWGAVENARSMLSGDWQRLVRQGQCWPMPASTTLGEHMIELGVLASPWWITTRDPVASYNLLFATALVVAASGMFLFLYRHTGSVAASLVGALVFAFATPRLVDLPYHPAVIGTHWIPWVLWSFDRSLDRPRAASLVLFAVTLLLSGLVGSYPLIAIAIVGAAYGSSAIVRQWKRRELDRVAVAWCAAATLPAIVLVGGLLGTYARTHADWMLQPNTGGKFLVSLRDYLPGGLMSVGVVSLAGLLPLALLRGAGATAVPGLVVASVASMLVATSITTGTGESWSVFEALARRVALLDSVRAPGKAGLAVCFAVQALGAVGWARLFRTMGSAAQAGAAAVLIFFVALEASPPEALRGVLGAGAAMQLRRVAPDAERVAAFTTALAADARPVLDLPLGRMVRAPLQLLDAAYHGHETSACYNSLVPPTMRAAYALAGRPARNVTELSAAGFGYVVERRVSPARPLRSDTFPPPAKLLVFDESFSIWQLPLPGTVHHDPSKLSFEVQGGATRSAYFAPEPPWELDVEITNRSDATWALPDPPTPLLADVELAGSTTLKTRARGVLPLALEAGESTTIQLLLFEEPAPGPYRVTVTLEGIGEIPVAPDFVWSGP